MAINVISVQYNDGFLPDIKLLTLCYYHLGTLLNDMKRSCPGSLCSRLNALFGGMFRRFRCVQIYI